MPPKRGYRRPAAAVVPPAGRGILRRPAIAKAKARLGNRSKAAPKAGTPKEADPPWIEVQDLKVGDVTIGSRYIAKVYGMARKKAWLMSRHWKRRPTQRVNGLESRSWELPYIN